VGFSFITQKQISFEDCCEIFVDVFIDIRKNIYVLKVMFWCDREEEGECT